jgi:uncharacterized protein YjbI with pentapeptide repeats
MKTVNKIIFTTAIISLISLHACNDKYELAECSYIINIPDTALKNELLKTLVTYDSDREGVLDENMDGEICDGEALRLKELVLPNEAAVISFEGIQHFPNLRDLNLNNCNFDSLSITSSSINYLRCSSVSLKRLDVSNLENLTELVCGRNNLTELDLSNNIKLTELYCGKNMLTELDVTNNVNLHWLSFWENNITGINLEGLDKLTQCDFHGNQISAIDLSENINLTILNFQGNPISEIDLSSNTAIVGIYFGDNPMTMLDISKNQNLITLENEGEFPFDTICVWTLPFPPSGSITLKNFPASFDGFKICE